MPGWRNWTCPRQPRVCNTMCVCVFKYHLSIQAIVQLEWNECLQPMDGAAATPDTSQVERISKKCLADDAHRERIRMKRKGNGQTGPPRFQCSHWAEFSARKMEKMFFTLNRLSFWNQWLQNAPFDMQKVQEHEQISTNCFTGIYNCQETTKNNAQ